MHIKGWKKEFEILYFVIKYYIFKFSFFFSFRFVSFILYFSLFVLLHNRIISIFFFNFRNLGECVLIHSSNNNFILFHLFVIYYKKIYTFSFTIILKLIYSLLLLWWWDFFEGVYEAKLVIVVMGNFDGKDLVMVW